MRQVAEKIGAPAATVSQTEKGERALKEPKIEAWSAALDVNEADLRELWELCQGLVPTGDLLVFYTDPSNPLSSEPLSSEVRRTLRERPDLEPVYRLAARIAAVLGRLLPHATILAEADELDRFKDERSMAGLSLPDEAEEHAAAIASFDPIPFINYYQAGWSGPSLGVGVPVLQQPTRVMRRRGKSMDAADLEDLIRTLSGPERERVRGYIEAVLEQRADLDD